MRSAVQFNGGYWFGGWFGFSLRVGFGWRMENWRWSGLEVERVEWRVHSEGRPYPYKTR